MDSLRIDYQTAENLFEVRCPHRAEFPYKLLCKESDTFLLVNIPIVDLQFSETDWSRCCSKRSEAKVRVLQDISNHDPIWVYFRKRDKQIKIADGYHRTAAKVRNGITNTLALFPQTHYDRYFRVTD